MEGYELHPIEIALLKRLVPQVLSAAGIPGEKAVQHGEKHGCYDIGDLSIIRNEDDRDAEHPYLVMEFTGPDHYGECDEYERAQCRSLEEAVARAVLLPIEMNVDLALAAERYRMDLEAAREDALEDPDPEWGATTTPETVAAVAREALAEHVALLVDIGGEGG